jgi:hypothetical protein
LVTEYLLVFAEAANIDRHDFIVALAEGPDLRQI